MGPSLLLWEKGLACHASFLGTAQTGCTSEATGLECRERAASQLLELEGLPLDRITATHSSSSTSEGTTRTPKLGPKPPCCPVVCSGTHLATQHCPDHHLGSTHSLRAADFSLSEPAPPACTERGGQPQITPRTNKGQLVLNRNNWQVQNLSSEQVACHFQPYPCSRSCSYVKSEGVSSLDFLTG